ncbi:tRNA (34-2'-O)-methyltransferase regulator WDR6-like [Macrobrachium nipponense]|uniref:tRNA (34-2'-O)-methyltransferase regulator WDR6-like n=1 Tax=Macrobrachium nipponense TaxID=159736 RepID=UPI0030C8B7DA
MVLVKELLLSTQISAVKVNQDTVFIGEGQYLHIHSLATGERLADIRVFQAAAIHGIKIISSLDRSSIIWKTLVWGQKLGSHLVQANRKPQLHNALLHVKVIEGPAEHILPGSETNKPLDNSALGCFEIRGKEQCSENCILYCGCIVVGSGFYESAVLLAGTVFSQVLIWGPWGEKDQHGRLVPLHCLSGHQGVLFSINFCQEENVITTTSDDRTLIIWKIHKQDENVSKVKKYWNCCQITEEHKCYGHGSRVWKSLILPFCYISVGEDSKVCVWSHDGELRMSWQGHDGACIWSIDASEDGTKIVTGGGDGSVKSWCLKQEGSKNPEVMIELPWVSVNTETEADSFSRSFQNKTNVREIQSRTETHDVKCEDDINISNNLFECDLEVHSQAATSVHSSVVTEDFPRCVALFGVDTYLVMLDSGKLYSWNCKVSEWFLVYEDQRLKNYAVMESSPDQQVVALGTLCGHVAILTAGMFYNGFLLRITLKIKGQTYTLPVCKQRWVSAACYFTIQNRSHLICGDRAGSIHLYSENSSEPQHSLRSIHGERSGVTSLINHQGYLYSTGRDGCIRCLTVQDYRLQVLTVTRVSSANWIASLINLRGRLLAVCFHDVKLKLWSLEEDRAIIDIECGGGHRSWDLQCSEENNKLSFIYIKDAKPYTFSTTLEDKLMPLIKTPINTRETMCLEVLLQQDDTTYFATGGEDTTLRLHALSSYRNKQLKTFSVIRSHISNVRTMCCIENMNEKVSSCEEGTSKWIVTAGGRAQLKIWKMFYLHSGSDREKEDPPDICCREVTSHMLRTGSNKTWKSQEMTFDPETRYMEAKAFWVSREKALIILASSDGFVRFFEFDNHLEQIRLLHSQAWDHCLLKLTTLLVHDNCILVSGATDGFLVFWNIQPILDYIANKSDDYDDCHPVPEMSKVDSIKAHQSGINSIAITSEMNLSGDFNPYSLIIASGGDDNKIALWKITGHFTEDKRLNFHTNHVCEVHGHASQVTG